MRCSGTTAEPRCRRAYMSGDEAMAELLRVGVALRARASRRMLRTEADELVLRVVDVRPCSTWLGEEREREGDAQEAAEDVLEGAGVTRAESRAHLEEVGLKLAVDEPARAEPPPRRRRS